MDRKNLYVVLGIIGFLMLGGLVTVFFAQGSLLPGTNCEWEHVPHAPGQADHFESIDQFITEYAQANDDVTESYMRDNYDFRMENGQVEYQSCPVKGQ